MSNSSFLPANLRRPAYRHRKTRSAAVRRSPRAPRPRPSRSCPGTSWAARARRRPARNSTSPASASAAWAPATSQNVRAARTSWPCATWTRTCLDRNAKQLPQGQAPHRFPQDARERRRTSTRWWSPRPTTTTPWSRMMAIKMGKHVHCQKPLTHSVYEARMIGKAAKEAKVATQMGNQGQASEEARLICETDLGRRDRHGARGPRRLEPHPDDLAARHSAAQGHAAGAREPGLGPAGSARRPMRPYHPCYHPFAWRGWWDFGTGCLGDIGCHQFSAVFKALKLGHPDERSRPARRTIRAGRRSPTRRPRWRRSPAGISRPRATGRRSRSPGGTAA